MKILLFECMKKQNALFPSHTVARRGSIATYFKGTKVRPKVVSRNEKWDESEENVARRVPVLTTIYDFVGRVVVFPNTFPGDKCKRTVMISVGRRQKIKTNVNRRKQRRHRKYHTSRNNVIDVFYNMKILYEKKKREKTVLFPLLWPVAVRSPHT